MVVDCRTHKHEILGPIGGDLRRQPIPAGRSGSCDVEGEPVPVGPTPRAVCKPLHFWRAAGMWAIDGTASTSVEARAPAGVGRVVLGCRLGDEIAPDADGVGFDASVGRVPRGSELGVAGAVGGG